MAMQAAPEKLAYLALINPEQNGRPDEIAVIDVDPVSSSYTQMVGNVAMSAPGDELFNPKKTASVHLGGIVRRAEHPASPGQALNGGPQMVEISRDGRRVYFTNSLYTPWDSQFYPDGIQSWMVKLDADPEGGMELDRNFFLEFDGMRSHQVRLEGGDASSDSYCYS